MPQKGTKSTKRVGSGARAYPTPQTPENKAINANSAEGAEYNSQGQVRSEAEHVAHG